MKKRNFLLFVIISLFLIGFVFAVVNFFVAQNPSDVNTFNLFATSILNPHLLNITYNISDPNLVFSTIKLYYKTNSSTFDTGFLFVNGSLYQNGFASNNYSSNFSDVFVFLLSDNQVYPATYNYNQTYMVNSSKLVFDHDDSDTYLKIRFFNVSNLKNYSFFEIYADNQTTTSDTLRLYYCNESYVGNVTPLTSAFCTNFYNMPASEPFNHTHSSFSKHHVIPFPINATTKQIGGVYVTNTSYFLLRGRNTLNAWNVYYIPNVSRADTIQEDTNGGVGIAWNNFAGTIDAHLHQYDGTDTLWYYACANDSLGNQECTALRNDLLDLGGLSPISVGIYSPVNQSYRGNISINYTAAVSPNSYDIAAGYNISLYNISDDFISLIDLNNSLNLSFIWDSTGTTDGIYNIHVWGCDVNQLCSVGESDDFILDNTNPTFTFTCNPSSVNIGEEITCSCTGSDATSGISSISYTQHPSTASIGTHSTSCTLFDVAGNSVSTSVNYSVTYSGGSGGGGSSGGGSSTKPIMPTPEIISPTPEETGKNETIQENELVGVIVDNQNYSLNVSEIKNNFIKFNFYDGVEKGMFIGDEVNYQIGENIITIKLEKIENGKAIFNVLITKKIPKIDYQNIAIIAGIVVLSVMISLKFIIKQKSKIKRKKK